MKHQEEATPGTIMVKTLFAGKYLEIGHVTFIPHKDRVQLHTISLERMERLRKSFEEIAGDRVRFLAESITSPESIQEGAGKEDTEGTIPDHEQADWRWMEYLTWLHTPDPAFNGLTPSEAWQDRALRPEVEKHLRSFEAIEFQFKRTGQRYVDIERLRYILESH